VRVERTVEEQLRIDQDLDVLPARAGRGVAVHVDAHERAGVHVRVLRRQHRRIAGVLGDDRHRDRKVIERVELIVLLELLRLFDQVRLAVVRDDRRGGNESMVRCSRNSISNAFRRLFHGSEPGETTIGLTERRERTRAPWVRRGLDVLITGPFLP
jgi:hypothetical protein